MPIQLTVGTEPVPTVSPETIVSFSAFSVLQEMAIDLDPISVAVGTTIGLLVGVLFSVIALWVLWDEVKFFVKQGELEERYREEVNPVPGFRAKCMTSPLIVSNTRTHSKNIPPGFDVLVSVGLLLTFELYWCADGCAES